MHKILIVIVSYNVCRYMQNCIQSIRKHLPADTYKICVVDNASTDGVAEWLATQQDILLIRNSENVGFGPACNQGVNATKGTEYEDCDVFLLNNDTILTKNSVQRLMDALYSSEDVGAVGAMSNSSGNLQTYDFGTEDPDKCIQIFENTTFPPENRLMERVRLCGFAMLFRRNVWDAIGGFDEDFAPGYYEDDAISMEVMKLGYRLLLVKDSFIYHFGSAGFSKGSNLHLAIEHHELFIKKYNFDLLPYVYADPAVLLQIPFDRNDSFSVLHLGSNLGAEIKAIHSLYPNATCYGIETDPHMYEISKHTEKVFSSIDDACNHLFSSALSSVDLLIIDDQYTKNLSSPEKEALDKLSAKASNIINKLHIYDSFSYDKLLLIIWKQGLNKEALYGMLAEHGIINISYSLETQSLSALISYCGIPQERILVISDIDEDLVRTKETFPQINAANKSILPYLLSHSYNNVQNTIGMSRQRAFDVHMKKFKTSAADRITICINHNCVEKAPEISNMLSECDLLDYTKANADAPYIARISANDWNDCGYITAKDDYSDYGIIGYFCYNRRSHQMLHFAFSWRATGMGIEHYIYNILRCPDFEYASPVDHPLKKGFIAPYITEDKQNAIISDRIYNSRVRLLLKCSKELDSIATYLIGGNVTTEYDSDYEKDTYLFQKEYHVIVYSLLQYDLDSWNKNSEYMLSNMFETLDSLCDSTPGNPLIVLLLGSETWYENGDSIDSGLAELYSELNPIIYDYANDHDRIRIINITSMIKGQNDFKDSINCFSIRVFSDITEAVVKVINERVDEIIQSRL